jgi:hypothetical protein
MLEDKKSDSIFHNSKPILNKHDHHSDSNRSSSSNDSSDTDT